MKRRSLITKEEALEALRGMAPSFTRCEAHEDVYKEYCQFCKTNAPLFLRDLCASSVGFDHYHGFNPKNSLLMTSGNVQIDCNAHAVRRALFKIGYGFVPSECYVAIREPDHMGLKAVLASEIEGFFDVLKPK